MKRPPAAELDPRVRDSVVDFLREWIPEPAKEVYREMMAEDPEHWSSDPHFGGGIVVEHFLRGNGLDENALGVPDLEPFWRDLLRRAVLTEDGGR